MSLYVKLLYAYTVNDGDFIINMFTVLEEKVDLPAIIYNFMDEPNMPRYFTDTFATYP